MLRRMFVPLVFLPVLAGFFVLSVGAGPTFAKRVALVVGNAAYQHATRLENTINDATKMADTLEELGFEVIRGLDLTRDDLYQRGEQFIELQRVRDADAALFFYAGHGLQVDGENYLMPIDASLEHELSLISELTPLADFVNSTMNSSLNLAFLDACRNNPLATVITRSFSRNVQHGRLAQMWTQPGTVLAYATQPGTVAAEGEGQHSPYTAALLHHLQTPGLDVHALLNEVGRSVMESTERRQVPAVLSLPQERDFFFREGEDPAREAFTAAEQFERRSSDTGVAITKYEAVMQNFADSDFAKQARRRIRELRIAKNEIEQIRRSPPRTPDRRAMVFVPGGEFFSGCGKGMALCTAGRTDDEKEEERKDKEVVRLDSTHVDAFWIDMREVTIAAYRQCVEVGQCSGEVETPHPAPPGDESAAKYCTWNKNDPQLPINCVSWHQAETYCRWAGKRLPSEMEWEKAARGKDGRETPWGSRNNIQVANLADETLRNHEEWEERWQRGEDVEITKGYRDEHMEIAPVGSYPAGASPYGVLDMAGNLWEWVADWYEEGETRSRRGGSWLSHLDRTRTFFHAWRDPDERRVNLGFRCALPHSRVSPRPAGSIIAGD